jgi:predicted alpha/beta-fold hydrolase
MPVIAPSTYKAPLLCSNPHLQTIVPSVLRRVRGVEYERERIETPDGDFLDLDWSRLGSQRVGIVLHGMEGDSTRSYMKGMVKALNRRGWDAVAMNFRGCSGETNRLLRMYHGGETGDLHTVIGHVMATADYDQLALVGFSLGGNVVLKYLGENGSRIQPGIRAAVAFSVPCDVKGCSARLSESGNRPYTRRFLKMMRDKIRAKALMMPDRISDAGYETIKTVMEFDDKYTAPIHGFRDVDDLYEKASSRQFLNSITVPTLLINAADDPFLSQSCFPYAEAKANPQLFLEIPRHGGHVGFMTFNNGGEYWSETRACTFLQSIV